MTKYEQDYYWYWFVNIKGIGNYTRVKLMQEFSHPSVLYHCEKEKVKEFLTEKQYQAFQASKEFQKIEEGRKCLAEENVEFISWESPFYPERLRNLYDPPYGFYLKGKLPDSQRPAVAIVGSRKATPYGKEMAEYFASCFARQGIVVISGMAAGIDAHAHRGSLKEGGETLGILGGGINTMYPKDNWNLYLDMYQAGGIFSEYNLGVINRSGLFPMRNRLISAMADCILVVEGGEKSGSLITADQGIEQGKEIYAIPGRITDSLSRGCNHLIAQGASVAESPEQMILDMQEQFSRKGKRFAAEHTENIIEENRIFPGRKWENVSQEEQEVLDILDENDPRSVEYMIQSLDISWGKLQHILCELELREIVVQIQQNLYLKKIF